jgi:long-chain acyl-CoA synthetase
LSRVVDSFSACRQRAPGRFLLHLPSTGHSVSADDIWQAQRIWAQRFRDAGLEPGHVLVVAVGNRAPIVPLLLAARACGLVWMPAESSATDAEIAGLRDRYQVAATVLPLSDAAEDGSAGLLTANLVVRADLPAAGCYPGIAAMKLTSGSTGVPRATRTTEDQLVIDTRQIQEAMGIRPQDTQMAVIPLSHAYGLSVVLMPLLLQGTAIVLRETFIPEQWLLDSEQFAVNSFPGVPFMFQHLLAKPPARWPVTIERITSAGAPLPLETARAFRERFGVKIHSFYGTTEAGGIAYDGSDEDNEDTVGTPLSGVTVTLAPDEGAPPGGGRVHVSSAAVSSGYASAAGEDDEFCDGGYLTGDYGVLERGRLRLTGRVSSFVNVAGRKVRPIEVEDVLRAMPGIRDVRVMAGVDERRGEQVVACIVADPAGGPALAPLEVRRFCGQRLAPYKVPRAFVFLKQMPLTPRGKLDRRALEALVRAELDRMQ